MSKPHLKESYFFSIQSKISSSCHLIFNEDVVPSYHNHQIVSHYLRDETARKETVRTSTNKTNEKHPQIIENILLLSLPKQLIFILFLPIYSMLNNV